MSVPDVLCRAPVPGGAAERRPVFMSGSPKRAKKPAKRSTLGRIVRGLYIILFALSLVVVVSFEIGRAHV